MRLVRSIRSFLLGEIIAAYLQFVWRTRLSLQIFPNDLYSVADEYLPCILATWHGQNYMLPFFRRTEDNIEVLVSRHRDGQLMVRALVRLGFGIIRGSGAGPVKKQMVHKGGTAALAKMIESLKGGSSVALTADLPKIPRKAGDGILKLAFESGRPIVPIAAATSRRRVLNRSSDKTALPCAFSKIVFVIGEPIVVSANTSQHWLIKRGEIEQALEKVNVQALEIAES